MIGEAEPADHLISVLCPFIGSRFLAMNLEAGCEIQSSIFLPILARLGRSLSKVPLPAGGGGQLQSQFTLPFTPHTRIRLLAVERSLDLPVSWSPYSSTGSAGATAQGGQRKKRLTRRGTASRESSVTRVHHRRPRPTW